MDSGEVELRAGRVTLTLSKGNPRLVTLLSMYDDPVTGEKNIPDVIELQGSVKDIVEEEGDAYATVTNIACNKMMTPLMDSLIDSTPHPPLPTVHRVPYESVERISRIFDWRLVDFLGVYITKETPKRLRDAYYKGMGELVCGAKLTERIMESFFNIKSIFCIIIGAFSGIGTENIRYMIGMIYARLVKNEMEVISGSSDSLNDEVVSWEDWIELLERVKGSDDEERIRAIKLMKYLSTNNSDRLTQFAPEFDVVDFSNSRRIVINAIMRRMDVITLGDIGLDLIGKRKGGSSSFAKIIDELNRVMTTVDDKSVLLAILTLVYNRIYPDMQVDTKGLGDVWNALQLRKILGHNATYTILIVLLKEIEAGRGTKKIEALASAIESLD